MEGAVAQKEDIRTLIKKYYDIVSENNTITISTVSRSGKLWSTKTYYGDENGYLYICIENKGNAFANIKENPNIFFVIEKNDPMRFIQGEGVVEIIGPSEEHPIERSYYLRKNFPAVGFIRMVPTTVIRIKPTTVYVSDFSRGWVPRQTLTFDDENFRILQSLYAKRSKWKYWVQATRPWVIGITIIAVIMGTLLAVPSIHKVNWGIFILTMLGSVFAHLGVNAWSDYFDYRKGADKWNTLGSSRTIVDYLLKPATVLAIGASLIVLALICGIVIYFLMNKPVELLYLMLGGAITGLFYAFIPVGWKYIALGDIAVFIAWSLICVGSYFTQTAHISYIPFLAFLPIAILVVGILHGNNMRDIADDIRAGYRTLAGILGVKGSQVYYTILILAAYISLVVMVIKGILPGWCLLAILTFPYAWQNIKWAWKPNYLQFNMLDYYTANLSNKIGIIVVVGILLDISGI